MMIFACLALQLVTVGFTTRALTESPYSNAKVWGVVPFFKNRVGICSGYKMNLAYNYAALTDKLHASLIPPHNPCVADLRSHKYFESHIRNGDWFKLVGAVDSLAVFRPRAA